jgi:hypothetical protein
MSVITDKIDQFLEVIIDGAETIDAKLHELADSADATAHDIIAYLKSLKTTPDPEPADGTFAAGPCSEVCGQVAAETKEKLAAIAD